MESQTCLSAFIILGVLLLARIANASYTRDYYSDSCPQAASLIRKKVNKIIAKNRNLAGGFLRLHFHDCFVRGCDASVLLDSATNSSEKHSPANAGTLRGLNEIDEIKAELEAECPGIVSCADILALAARDATAKVGGHKWSVDLGRKDGFVSIDSEANQHLPSPFSTYDELVQSFSEKGFSEEEMIVLSGSHTIGRSSCPVVIPRLYDFNGVANLTDPSLDTEFAEKLKQKCPRDEQGSILSMDPSRNNFDHLYFKAVLKNRGLFQSDATLLTNPVGKKLVRTYSKPSSSFKSDFAVAMTKVSNLNSASEGEIRRTCSAVNQ